VKPQKLLPLFEKWFPANTVAVGNLKLFRCATGRHRAGPSRVAIFYLPIKQGISTNVISIIWRLLLKKKINLQNHKRIEDNQSYIKSKVEIFHIKGEKKH
jgi:hypothetical protein